MTRDILASIRSVLEEVCNETKEKITEESIAWDEWYEIWDKMHWPLLGLPDFERNNSLVFLRFLELQKQIKWFSACVFCGAYHSAIRELRYTLESMLQAYYLDTEHPLAERFCKLEILKEIEKELYGTKLIFKLDLPEKQELKEVYHILCKYVHSSFEEMKPLITQDKAILFKFDEDLFKKCLDLMDKVMDKVFYVVLKRFPILKNKLKRSTLKTLSERRYKSTFRELDLPQNSPC